MRILIAEDETIIRLDLRGLLERAGLRGVAEAKDGEEAVSLAREHEPRPGGDGREDASPRRDRRRPADPRGTADPDRDADRVRPAGARRARRRDGVYGYLVKPFREQDVLPAIETARARHEELMAVRAEADSLSEALAARKAIERAKGLLMEKEKLSEADAFARLRTSEPGFRTALAGDCRGCYRYVRAA